MKLKTLVSAIALATAAIAAPAHAGQAKNVIVLLSDGASAGTWDMASYYEYGQKGMQSYDQFSVKLGMTTFPLNTSSKPTGTGIAQITYDATKAWDTTAVSTTTEGRANYFAGYQYLKQGWTDSAAAATAISTGTKTYNNAINYDDFSQKLPYVTQMAKDMGKSTGVVSSVAFSHATPAGFAAQNISRNNYAAISEEMISNKSVDLVMGAGNPMYNDNGQLNASGNYYYMSKTAYETVTGSNSPRTLIQDKSQFEALANGTLTVDGPLMGLAKVGGTLQQSRSAGAAFNTEVPTLETMTKGALNYLSQDKDGFFVMIEGGAVDWAAHANQTDRVIEEQVDFNKSVTAAVNWVNANSNWDETLMIVLTDHGNGLPLGPNSDTVAFQAVQNNGQGVLPGVKWHTGNHTNENTLLWANGAGAEYFYNEVDGIDPQFAAATGHGDGRYITNTDVFNVMTTAMAPVPEPETYAMLLAGLGMIGFVARRHAAK